MISRGKPSFDFWQASESQAQQRLGVIKRVALGLAFLFSPHYPPQPSKEAGGESKKESLPASHAVLVPDSQPNTLNCLSYFSSSRYWITTVDSYAYRPFI